MSKQGYRTLCHEIILKCSSHVFEENACAVGCNSYSLLVMSTGDSANLAFSNSYHGKQVMDKSMRTVQHLMQKSPNSGQAVIRKF